MMTRHWNRDTKGKKKKKNETRRYGAAADKGGPEPWDIKVPSYLFIYSFIHSFPVCDFFFFFFPLLGGCGGRKAADWIGIRVAPRLCTLGGLDPIDRLGIGCVTLSLPSLPFLELDQAVFFFSVGWQRMDGAGDPRRGGGW
jgi:hypothetical protein